MPVVVGLLGGIGSGKSAVARILQSRGGVVLDADARAREALDTPPIQRLLAERFGSAILGPEGTIDRGALGRAVFGGPDGEEHRKWLESVVHPYVREQLRLGLEDARGSDPPPRWVVLDVPLLLEGPLREWCDVLLFVDAPHAARKKRTVEIRGWAADELDRREKTQRQLEEKRRAADHVIPNCGTLADLERAVLAILPHIGPPESLPDGETP